MRLNCLTWPCALLVVLAAPLVTLGVPPGFHPVIVVEAAYPGADARTVADSVAAPIEEQVNGVEHLTHMVSRCTNDGHYTLLLSFDSGIDLNVSQVLVQNRVAIAGPQLPNEVQNNGVVFRKLAPAASLILVLTSPDASKDTLYLGNFAAIQIKDELIRLAGVGEVSLIGGAEYAVSIILDRDKLAVRKLTPADVLSALREQNAKTKAEQLGQPPAKPGEPFQLRLSTKGRLANVEDIADIIVKTGPGGGLVRVRDVARVELGRGRSRGEAKYDGRPAVALAIAPTPTAKARDVSIAVRERMQTLNKSFPAGIDYTVALDLAPKAIIGKSPLNWCLLAEPILPASSSPERILECQIRYADILKKTEGVQHVLVLPENPFALFPGRPCVAAVANSDLTEQDWDKIQRLVRERLLREVKSADLRLRELSGPAGVRPDGYPVEFALRGPDPAELGDLAETLTERLRRTGKLTDVAVTAKTIPQLYIDIDRKRLAALGLSLSDVNETLQVALGSAEIGEANQFGRTWQVRVDAGSRVKTADLKKIQVRSHKGEMVPLATVITIRETDGPTSVDRVDMYPAAIISGNSAAGVSLAEARWLCETLLEQVRKEQRLPEKYALVWLQEVPAAKPMPGEPKVEPEAPLEVTVAPPIAREVTDYEDFTGRIDAAQTVDLRARVTGYLDKVMFKEGTDVKKGDALFVIDPRPYQAALDQVQAKLKVAEAQRDFSKRDLARLKAVGAAVPIADIDKAEDAVRIATAEIAAAKAAVELAKLNLDFSTVRAPIDGRIGRSAVDAGNLVRADETLLATLVSLDPVYVYFDIDERTLLHLERLAREGKAKALAEAELPVSIGLANETDFPHRGKLNFVDNRVNPDTGTLRLRAVLPNSDRSLRPGMFARVRLPIGAPHKALLVPEEAIHSDASRKIVYVVDDGNKVVVRKVTIGATHDGRRVIEQGLLPDDRVIIESRVRVRPGQTVKPITAKP